MKKIVTFCLLVFILTLFASCSKNTKTNNTTTLKSSIVNSSSKSTKITSTTLKTTTLTTTTLFDSNKIYASKPKNIAQGIGNGFTSSDDRNGVMSEDGLITSNLTNGNNEDFTVTSSKDIEPWAKVRLKNETYINKVIVYFEYQYQGSAGLSKAYAKEFDVLVSLDDKVYHKVASVDDGIYGANTIVFPAIYAKYVKIEVRFMEGFYTAFDEIMVYEADQNVILKEQDKMNVLFIGNSHTYVNDLPGMVLDLFNQNNKVLNFSEHTVGGQTLDGHFATTKDLQAIRSNNYDYIILQEKASDFDSNLFKTGFDKLYNYIKENSDSEIVLYMIWSNESRPEVQERIVDAYLEAAVRTSSRLAATGVAWDIIRHNYKNDFKLYSDGNHALPVGTYLAASAIYYALTGDEKMVINEGNLLASKVGISIEKANLIQDIVYDVYKNGYDVRKLLVYANK